jgi:hypothetical protein
MIPEESMYLPKAATSSRVVFTLQTPPAAPLATSPTNHRGQQNQALATSLPESSKERPGRIPPGHSLSQGEKQARSRFDVYIQYGIVSTKLWGSKRLRKISHALAPAASLRLYRGSGKRFFTRFKFMCSVHPHGKLRIGMRGSRERQNVLYCTGRCAK